MRATTITAAMATMATVETAKSTRLCYPWGPFVKTYAASGTARARASATAVVRPLTNGAPAHVLTREERARGGRVRASNARERRSSLRHAPRGGARLIEAAGRLGDAAFGKPRVGHVGGRSDQAPHSSRDVEAHIRARRAVQPAKAPGSLILPRAAREATACLRPLAGPQRCMERGLESALSDSESEGWDAP
jgi:hypothetical protein